jgi:hypothetical protein
MSWAANATVIDGRTEYRTQPEAEVLQPQSSDLDPFFKVLANRCGPSIAGSFTPSQFTALKRAFAAQTADKHPVDVRDSYSLFGLPFYFVLLMGREKRSAARRKSEAPGGVARVVRGSMKALWWSTVLAACAIIVIVCSATN